MSLECNPYYELAGSLSGIHYAYDVQRTQSQRSKSRIDSVESHLAVNIHFWQHAPSDKRLELDEGALRIPHYHTMILVDFEDIMGGIGLGIGVLVMHTGLSFLQLLPGAVVFGEEIDSLVSVGNLVSHFGVLSVSDDVNFAGLKVNMLIGLLAGFLRNFFGFSLISNDFVDLRISNVLNIGLPDVLVL